MRPKALQAALVTIVVATVILLLLLSVDRYDWMRQMDPSIRPGDIQDVSQNGRLFAGVTAAVGGSAALLIGIVARKTRGRLLAIGAATVVATIWLVRFAG